jgi:hypothetical protein
MMMAHGSSAPTDFQGKNPIFVPYPVAVSRSQMTAFIAYCERECGLKFHDYASFHQYSAKEFHSFWRLFLAEPSWL